MVTLRIKSHTHTHSHTILTLPSPPHPAITLCFIVYMEALLEKTCGVFYMRSENVNIYNETFRWCNNWLICFNSTSEGNTQMDRHKGCKHINTHVTRGFVMRCNIILSGLFSTLFRIFSVCNCFRNVLLNYKRGRKIYRRDKFFSFYKQTHTRIREIIGEALCS